MTTSITVRLPADLHSRVREAARDSDRSLSAEIVHRVRRSFAAPQPGEGPHRLPAAEGVPAASESRR
jgi:Arc-like DNA binding dprotein